MKPTPAKTNTSNTKTKTSSVPVSQPDAVTLQRYDAACKALAEAKAVDEVLEIKDAADRMRYYARQAKNRQLEIDAVEIRFKAERRIGELIKAQSESDQINRGGRPSDKPGSKTNPVSRRPTLAEVLGPNHKEIADRARKLAALPRAAFDGLIDRWCAHVRQETERRVSTNLLHVDKLGEPRRQPRRQDSGRSSSPAGRPSVARQTEGRSAAAPVKPVSRPPAADTKPKPFDERAAIQQVIDRIHSVYADWPIGLSFASLIKALESEADQLKREDRQCDPSATRVPA